MTGSTPAGADDHRRERRLRRLHRVLFRAALGLTLAFFAILTWSTWQSFRGFERVVLPEARFAAASGTIGQLDEALTMSARMATATGDPQWERRYLALEPLLDSAIQEIRGLAPDLFAGEAARATDAANRALVALEHRAFDLVRQGHRAAAESLLAAPDYETQKRAYAEGLRRIRSTAGGRARSQMAAERRRLSLTLALAGGLLPVLLLAWLAAEAMRRAQARATLAQGKAEAANRAKSVFLSSMSHELRTPLNAILGFSQLMRNAASASEEQRQTLDIINRSGKHLLALINDVLDMAKIEAGGIAVEIAPVDLGELVRDVADLMRERAGAKNLQLVLDQSSAFPRFVRTDGTKLRQVLINLVGNAIKYTERGSVTVRLNAGSAAPDARLPLLVEVEDTGAGISAEDQARIFDPFVQVGAATQQTGTGLGLAITRKYVELLGGRIGVESTPGRGSTFRVEVPVAPVADSDLSAAAIARGRVLSLEPGQPEHRILVVEDQMENWLLLQRLLEGVGFQVRVAENGAAGVEVFQAWRPDFIWMDVRMPVMDGLEATRRIRALEGGREVKIVALTASVFGEERANVLGAGMTDFIRKPYRAEEIFDCLARHLGVRFVYDEMPSASAAGPPAVPRPEA
jgi:signal transduction histidine kinase/ActR/RegA family two-component response regulator